jgi:hypothetical protein
MGASFPEDTSSFSIEHDLFGPDHALIGLGGWIRTSDFLLPRQAGTARLPYTQMIGGAHGRIRTFVLLVRSKALIL